MKILKLIFTYNLLVFVVSFFLISCNTKQSIRKDFLLNSGWVSIANDTNQNAHVGFELENYNTETWDKVDVPHNWDKYAGYRRMAHGNRHGYAWYRRDFEINENTTNQRIFLWFEGVGSYATVWVNGKKAGYHAGGRTSFTIDITDYVNYNQSNLLAVRADHPAKISDLPWVCGGCSDEWGFSEGSQPFGIFRPVHLIITNKLRIEPFGVHIWNDTTVNEKFAEINISTEIKNYTKQTREIILISSLFDKKGRKVAETKSKFQILNNERVVIGQKPINIQHPHLWSLEDPYLYTVQSEIFENDKIIDCVHTLYGIRWISWPLGRGDNTGQFLLNGKPVFLNGIGEYEHLFGNSHAFSDEQIKTRVMQLKNAGFNAFRDAHQPHNLKYQEYWQKNGILWWPQMAAHIWFNNPEFKENFKNLLKDFIKERRNNPSIILWGLENESTLPTEFALECVEIIRELDPTASLQRLITTCNGGSGTDWNVIQNWSGTYGGDPFNYANEISEQWLNGEYGAWRSIDLHTEGNFKQNGILSEDRMTELLELKVRLAESVKDQCCGQFLWLLCSHDNPGRVQNGEGLRDIDRIGPCNYKGLFTPWGEPVDAYYMFRSNYVSGKEEPMVYIVSHTWSSRWTKPEIKDNIRVYSNCDEVELFNDINGLSFGVKKKDGIGTHFRWDSVEIKYNVLYTIGYMNGKKAANDIIVLNHLPESPNFSKLYKNTKLLAKPKSGYNYLYRMNCGGPDYQDSFGNIWIADRHKDSDSTYGSTSWTDDFNIIPNFYGSQRRTFDPIENSKDWKLFQTFRYGRDKLEFNFPVENGEYLVELYFIEPWYSANTCFDCEGWRLFDVAINNETVINNLDLWKEAGHDKVIKKEFMVDVNNGEIIVSFPEVLSGQAVISAIAIATQNNDLKPAPAPGSVIQNLEIFNRNSLNEWKIKNWMDLGHKTYINENITFSELPSNFYASEWLQVPQQVDPENKEVLAQFWIEKESDIFIAMDDNIKGLPEWLNLYSDTKTIMQTDEGGGKTFKVYGQRFPGGSFTQLGNNGIAIEGRASMYFVVVCPVSNLDAAADQRPVKKFEAEDAKLIGNGLNKGNFKNNDYIQFTKNSGCAIEWEIYVGLASQYSLNYQFLNNTGNPIKMRIELIASTGITLCNEVYEFESKPYRWRTLKTTTCCSINAGIYKVRLSNIGQKGLGVDVLEVR